jgi:hypothetical protein
MPSLCWMPNSAAICSEWVGVVQAQVPSMAAGSLLGDLINWCCCAARSCIYLFSRPIGERESLRHAVAIVWSSAPSLRKKELLGAPTIGGGECPARAWGRRESKESNKPSKSPGTYENSAKTAGLMHLLIFYLKVLNKIYSQGVFWGIN